MRCLCFCIAILTCCFSTASAEKRVALVVGNSKYTHAGELVNPINDAMDMAAALKKLSFTVIDGFNLQKVAFEKKIREFSNQLHGADAAVFFYAGHGLQVGGVNYIVPVDAELNTAEALDLEMVRLDVIQRIMERVTKTNILFLDACRNNPLARNLARALGTRGGDVGRGLAPAESGIGTLISFSTQPGNVAQDGSGRNSPFTGPLVKRLATPDEDVLSILTAVRRDVLAATGNAQVPWENHALLSKFYFNPSGTTKEPKKNPILQERTQNKTRSFRDCLECPEMIVIPSGRFVMGSSDRGPDEQPAHEVIITKAFAVGKFEIKFSEWAVCQRELGCTHNPDDNGWGRGERPIINVSWHDATQYTEWLRRKTGLPYRLLTEAEWEYAAGAHQLPDSSLLQISVANANCDGCGSPWDNKSTSPVGSFAPNKFGLYDMRGNVAEWVKDWFASYTSDAEVDPLGPGSGGYRAIKGGSWLDPLEKLRSTARDKNVPNYRYYNIGFRIARSADN